MCKIKVGFFSAVIVFYINLIIGPGKEPRKERGKGFPPSVLAPSVGLATAPSGATAAEWPWGPGQVPAGDEISPRRGRRSPPAGPMEAEARVG